MSSHYIADPADATMVAGGAAVCGAGSAEVGGAERAGSVRQHELDTVNKFTV
jgi:hypothetical protein